MNREELKKSIGEDLCPFCPWTNGKIEKPAYGSCEGYYCDEALDNFLEENEQYFDDLEDWNMEWETKVELAKALNNGDNKKVCDIVLNNDMDMQAWDMILTGMDLRNYEEYRPLLGKIQENKSEISQNLKLREVLRMNLLLVKLEENK